MDINEKNIAEDMADMHIKENGSSEPKTPTMEKPKGPWRQAMKHQMRMHLKLAKGKAGAHQGVHPRHPFGPRHWGGPMMSFPGMYGQGPMMHPMAGQMGPMGPWMMPNAMLNKGQRRHFHHKGGNQQADNMTDMQRHFENHPFFMRRKWWRMANNAMNRAALSDSEKEGASAERIQADSPVAPNHPGIMHPAWFASSGCPPFMQKPGWKKCGKKNKLGKKEKKAEDASETETSDQEMDQAPEEDVAETEQQRQNQQKRDCLQRKRFRRMMMMQMMQNPGPFMLPPWMTVCHPMHKANRRQQKVKERSNNQEEAGSGPENTGPMEECQAKENPGMQWRRHRMMMRRMMQNSNPFLMSGMAPLQFPGRGWCRKQKEAVADQQSDETQPDTAEGQEGQKKGKPDCQWRKQRRMVKKNAFLAQGMNGPENSAALDKENDEMETGPDGTSTDAQNVSQADCHQRRRQRKMMQMMQQSSPFMFPGMDSPQFRFRCGGRRKHRKQEDEGHTKQTESEEELSPSGDEAVVDTADDDQAKKTGGNQERQHGNRKHQGSPCRKRRMQMMQRAMMLQQFGPFAFQQPWMYGPRPNFRKHSKNVQAKKTE